MQFARAARSPELLSELTEVLARPKFDSIVKCSNSSRKQMLFQVHMLAEVVDPPPLAKPVCRDPDDDAVLALAIAAQVDLIVSGDDDLLSLQSVQGICQPGDGATTDGFAAVAQTSAQPPVERWSSKRCSAN